MKELIDDIDEFKILGSFYFVRVVFLPEVGRFLPLPLLEDV